MYLGAHMPITGGLHMAVQRIHSLGGTALQIFTKNQRQWHAPELSEEDVSRFLSAWSAWGPYPVAAHDSYLVNLATPKTEHWEKSIEAVAEELRRVERLNITMLVTHPGAHLGAGAEAGQARYAEGLDRAIERSETTRPRVLLENTAGQGSSLGRSFEEIAGVFEKSRHPARLGVCLDTCHAFAAGYDLSTPAGVEQTLSRFDRVLGLDELYLAHLNDAQCDLGERRDRHEHIGRGRIGLDCFRQLLTNPRFASLPMIIETPKGPELDEDRMNLAVLRSLRDGHPAATS